MRGAILLNLNYLLQHRNELARKIFELQKEIKQAPPGDLICTQNSIYTKWYVSIGGTSKYIKKKEREYAERLARKKFEKFQLEEQKQELRVLNDYIASLEKIPRKSQQLLGDRRYIELLQHWGKKSAGRYQEWMFGKYEKNRNHLENLIHVTKSGYVVRSKSEMIIADALYANNIPFRYECELSLGEMTLYPDFTIINPVTEEIVYWEHFGMMDVPSYINTCFNKLNIYAQNGIIPTISLIATYETEHIPLNSARVEAVIESFFV